MEELEINAIITEVKTSPDGGLRLKIDTNEMPEEKIATLFMLKGEYLKLIVRKDG